MKNNPYIFEIVIAIIIVILIGIGMYSSYQEENTLIDNYNYIHFNPQPNDGVCGTCNIYKENK